MQFPNAVGCKLQIEERLFRVHDQLLIHTIRDPRDETDGEVPDSFGLKWRERPQDLRRAVWPTVSKRSLPRGSTRTCLPWTAEYRISYHDQLRDDTEDVQVRTMRK